MAQNKQEVIGIWVKTSSGMKAAHPTPLLWSTNEQRKPLALEVLKLEFAGSGRMYQGKDNLAFVLFFYSCCDQYSARLGSPFCMDLAMI